MERPLFIHIDYNKESKEIEIETDGDNADLMTFLIVDALSGDIGLSTVVLNAIPIFLDRVGIDRKQFCAMVMAANGAASLPGSDIPGQSPGGLIITQP